MTAVRSASFLGQAEQVAADIDRLPDAVAGSVICDAASCFPVLINAPRADVYAIPSDRDFERLAADPPEFGVRYVLLADPDRGVADAVRQNFPDLWEDDGAPISQLVREWGDDNNARSHYRLYRVNAPKGDPRAHPSEDLTG